MIALDRTPPETIAADIERLGIDPARLWLGVGAGFSKKPLTTMREALPELREALPGVRLVLAAMGPKMCALAGAECDGVFFNWMTPEFAAGARERVEAGAREAGRETPPVFGYVRTAVGADAAERLAKEESFYRDLHKGYRDHFDRLGEPEGTVGVAAADADEAQEELSPLQRARHDRRPRPRQRHVRGHDRRWPKRPPGVSHVRSTAAAGRTSRRATRNDDQKRCLASSVSSESSMSGT